MTMVDECVLEVGRVCDCCRANARTIERLKRERDEALANGREVDHLVLDAVSWYFGQRRYSVTPSDEGGYYLHDNEGRYPKCIDMDDGSPKWPTVYMALRRARDATREGEK